MLKHIDRYESDWNSSYDLYVLVYKSGKNRRIVNFSNLPKTAKRFIANAENFQFMKDNNGKYFHRFSA